MLYKSIEPGMPSMAHSPAIAVRQQKKISLLFARTQCFSGIFGPNLHIHKVLSPEKGNDAGAINDYVCAVRTIYLPVSS
jgi:hypothetical protein